MSRHWTQYKYLNAELLWSFLEEQYNKLEGLVKSDEVESSELCKLLILGRRESLDVLADFLHDNEATLENIAVNSGILSSEEIDKIKKAEYGL